MPRSVTNRFEGRAKEKLDYHSSGRALCDSRNIFLARAPFFVTSSFRDLRRLYCDLRALSCLRTYLFFVAHFPSFEEKEVRNVKKLPASFVNIFSYTLTLYLFSKGLFTYHSSGR